MGPKTVFMYLKTFYSSLNGGLPSSGYYSSFICGYFPPRFKKDISVLIKNKYNARWFYSENGAAIGSKKILSQTGHNK